MLSVFITIVIVVSLILFLVIRANRLNLKNQALTIADNDALQKDYLSHGTRKNIEDPKKL
ncbi:hypothetical protein [Ornithinibacillus xuwenensis]|jgi:hypothetical protein|uniref:Uncharacterized protein n=1 Tax=Ornithinibacillus xuwenensis TaxID=3144668 RepID=A0ABU9XEC2_9BACI